MKHEQFVAEYNALREEEYIIKEKIEALEQRYIESLPFKVGDCVRIVSKDCPIEKAWVTRIKRQYWQTDVYVEVIRANKDGSRPKRFKPHKRTFTPEDVELIRKEK